MQPTAFTEGVSRVGVRATTQRRVFSSRARSRAQCGWSNVRGAWKTLLPERQLSLVTLLQYISYIYSRVTNREWMDPLGTLEANRSARLIASKRRVNFRAVDIRTPFSAAPGCSSNWIDRILLLLLRGRSGVIWTGSWKVPRGRR